MQNGFIALCDLSPHLGHAYIHDLSYTCDLRSTLHSVISYARALTLRRAKKRYLGHTYRNVLLFFVLRKMTSASGLVKKSQTENPTLDLFSGYSEPRRAWRIGNLRTFSNSRLARRAAPLGLAGNKGQPRLLYFEISEHM